MSFFDSHKSQQLPNGVGQELGSIKADPAAYLQQHGYNIPSGMTDPRQITQHLLGSGQIGNSRLQQVLRFLGAPGVK